MAKPSSVPTWATDTNYTGGAEAGTPTKVAPSVGRSAEGWEPAAKPPAQEFNWWKNLVGQWIAWITGFFVIDGSDNLTIPGDLNMTVNKHVQVSGTGKYKHGNKILNIPGSSGIANSGVTREFSGYSASIESTASTTITWAIPLHVGDRIKSVSIQYIGNGTANITAVDITKMNTAVPTSLFTTDPANPPASPMTELICNNTDHELVAFDVIFVGMVINAAGIRVYGLFVTYDRP